ncbi:MAG: prephenate dehydratase [Gammaproteobacteria bacterium]
MTSDNKLENELAPVREKIDAIDDKLIALINQRAKLVLDAAQLKRQSGQDVHFYRPEREAQQLRRIEQKNPGPIEKQGLLQVFRELISACLALEKKHSIAYLGPEGTFTQAAVLRHFGGSVNPRAFSGIDQVFREVAANSCDYGVVPVENSIEGVVNHTLDMFITSDLTICGEVHLRIHQNLLSLATDLQNINTVYSHTLSFAQCRQWLDNNLPKVECIHVNSNAEAARLAKADNSTAAIAGQMAASVYELNILAENIEDDPDNTTRFLVIGNEPVPPSGADKTSVLFAMPSKPGSLVKLLGCFADNKVNLSRIESRPSRQAMWEYVFFVDLEGHQQDAAIGTALEQLRQSASMVKVLGSYPVASL